MTEQAETNGTSNGNGKGKASALSVLLKEVAASKTKVNASDKKAVAAEFKKSMAEREKLQAQLDAFDKASGDLAVKMVRCFGGTHLEIDGIRYVPTSRGERVYYKRMGDNSDVEKL